MKVKRIKNPIISTSNNNIFISTMQVEMITATRITKFTKPITTMTITIIATISLIITASYLEETQEGEFSQRPEKQELSRSLNAASGE